MRTIAGLILTVFLFVTMGCTSASRKINDANAEIARAMASNYKQTIQACSFEALPGQTMEFKGVSKISCNYEAKPIAYVQQVPSDLEKFGNVVLGVAQVASPLVGMALQMKYQERNTRATFEGLTSLTGVMATGFGHNSTVNTNTSGSYNSATDRHDVGVTISGSSFDASTGDNRNNQPVTTTTDRHDVITPTPVVVTGP